MMKKVLLFITAALMSVSVFADRDVVPSDEVLSAYYTPGDVCVCFYVPADMNCNDIVITGSFNNFSSNLGECVATQPIIGYDGWYVASYTPEEEPDLEKGIQAIPVMLEENGNFNMEYKIGAATTIRGGVQVMQGASFGEIDLVNYGTDAPNVFTVDAWKHNPCSAIYHQYTITVVSDGCNGIVVPFLVGAMNSFAFQQMEENQAKTTEYGVPTYSLNFKAAENMPYQIVSGIKNPTTGLVPATGDSAAGWKDIAYMQKLVDGVWGRIPGEDGDYLLTHEDANIVWDLRDDNFRWARCVPAVAETYTLELVSNDEAMGTVEVTNLLGSDIIDNEDGTYTVPENTEVTILATPATGYQFDGWKEGNLGEFASCYYCGTAINTNDNPMTITMTADKAILATFSAKPERVVVGIRFPAENIPTTIELATSNDQWESGAEMEFISSTGFHMNSEIEAYADDTLIFRDANNHETVLCQYVPANGNGDGKWEVVKLVFGDEWTDDTWKGEPVKFIELELNNAAQYAWTVAGTTGINDVEGNNAQIFGGEKRIVINNAANATVAIYDVMGRTVVKEQRINTDNEVFAVPQRGMYIVRIGKAAKKVWVR